MLWALPPTQCLVISAETIALANTRKPHTYSSSSQPEINDIAVLGRLVIDFMPETCLWFFLEFILPPQ